MCLHDRHSFVFFSKCVCVPPKRMRARPVLYHSRYPPALIPHLEQYIGQRFQRWAHRGDTKPVPDITLSATKEPQPLAYV
ncbi:hypothetical protein BDV41DRAFT_543801 [Aspergillus transmontanensis]|uniref:Uncharacterized protein n=1 Tax=Aspergillus transmontanensis TaxID=1034304 RepID=A0A5N6VQQ4_9EURO|nr:hypothetical protein BDV41DRAFT_543801 [Aspergillus transmontanensis]